MTTLQDEWREYRDKVYPNGTNAIQNKECHQAFFAGAMMAFKAMNLAAESNNEAEADAVKMLESLEAEAFQVLSYSAFNARNRN